jgi:hypothetical protein
LGQVVAAQQEPSLCTRKHRKGRAITRLEPRQRASAVHDQESEMGGCVGGCGSTRTWAGLSSVRSDREPAVKTDEPDDPPPTIKWHRTQNLQ